MKRNLIVVSFLIILAAVSRFIPHGYNFTPIAGMALLGGALYNKRILAFLVPLIVLFITDFALNNLVYRPFFPDHEGLVFFSDFMLFTYIGTALMVIVGMTCLQKVTGPRILGSALLSSILFFLVTNFGSWLGNPLYPQTGGGLLSSYLAGLPFLSGHLVSNIAFSFILFGAYFLITNRSLKPIVRLS